MIDAVIRKGVPADIPVMLTIWRRAVEKSHAFLTQKDVDDLVPEAKEGLGKMETWIAEADGQATGFMAMNGNMIEALFVAPDRMGMGVGSILIRHATAIRGPGAAIRVDVNEENPDALGFYLSRGFVRIGRSETDSAGRPWPLIHLLLPSDAKQ
jgi:Acetyltransferases